MNLIVVTPVLFPVLLLLLLEHRASVSTWECMSLYLYIARENGCLSIHPVLRNPRAGLALITDVSRESDSD